MSDFYLSLNRQLDALLSKENHWLTNISQFCAFINMSLDEINWVGFYFTKPVSNSEPTALFLGPYQGNVACVDIPIGRGVCGSAAAKRETLVVEDVDQFDGHIACDSRSRSELVCPLLVEGQLLGVLDIDSPNLARFTQQDADGVNILLSTLIDSTDWRAMQL